MGLENRIKETDLFDGVTAEGIRRLAAGAAIKKFKANDTIVGEADPVRSFYVVLSGQLKLSRVSPEGKEQTLQLLGAGDPFGLCTAFATETFPAGAVAIGESEVLLIPGVLVEAVAKTEPALLLNIIRILSRRLKNSMDLIESLSLKEIPGRLAGFLVHELSRQKAGAQALELSISQRELSKILGVTPEALSRTFRKMADEGIAAASGRNVRILNQKALECLAEGD